MKMPNMMAKWMVVNIVLSIIIVLEAIKRNKNQIKIAFSHVPLSFCNRRGRKIFRVCHKFRFRPNPK
jgi:hypothetical protein